MPVAPVFIGFYYITSQDLWESVNQMSSVYWEGISLLQLLLGCNKGFMCHSRIKYHGSSRLPHTYRRGTRGACLSLPVGLAEAYLHSVMALVTLRRIPSVSAPPVSSVNPMMLFCTHKWVSRASLQTRIWNLPSFAVKRVIQSGSTKKKTLCAKHMLLIKNQSTSGWMISNLFYFPFSSVLAPICLSYKDIRERLDQSLSIKMLTTSMVVCAHQKTPRLYHQPLSLMLSPVLSFCNPVMKHSSPWLGCGPTKL